MRSSSSSVADDTAKPGSSKRDTENMDPNGDDHPPVRTLVVGESSGHFQTSRENLFNLVTEVEKEASVVRMAAMECQNIKAYAEESVKEAERRAAEAKRKAKRYASFAEGQHHRTTADKLKTAAEVTARRANMLDPLISLAEMVAKFTCLDAADMLRDSDKTETGLIDQDALESLEREKEHVLGGTVVLKNAEYRLLKAMQRCWERYLPPLEAEALRDCDADLTTPLINRGQTDNGPRERIIMTLAVISGIAGCILLILSVTLSLDESSFIAMLTAVALCTLLLLGYVIYKIAKKLITKRKLAYIHRRNAVLQFIDIRLAELTTFYMTKNIDIPPDE